MVIPAGRETLLSALQYSNALFSMAFTLAGTVTLVISVQPLKACFPIVVTGYPPSLLGMTMLPLVVYFTSVIFALEFRITYVYIFSEEI